MDQRIVKTNILVPGKLLDRAKIRAVKEKISFSEMVRRALKEYLSKPMIQGR
jgi:hypothetical protein